MTNTTKIEELVIEGITYVPKGSEYIKQFDGDIKIVVLQRG